MVGGWRMGIVVEVEVAVSGGLQQHQSQNVFRSTSSMNQATLQMRISS